MTGNPFLLDFLQSGDAKRISNSQDTGDVVTEQIFQKRVFRTASWCIGTYKRKIIQGL